MNMNNLIEERISLHHIKPKLNNPDKMIWRKYLVDLPDEVRNTVFQHIEKYPILQRMCWYNSHLLSILNDEIEVVNGWYGKKIQKGSDLYKFVKEYKSNDRFIKLKLTGSDTDTIIDRVKMIDYSKHSWNRYKGNNFCITTELNSDYKGTFVYLNEQEHLSGRVLTCNPNTRGIYLGICLSEINIGIRMGLKVVNRNFLKS
jgi:hypothetical protein